jgi:hypothetical protein
MRPACQPCGVLAASGSPDSGFQPLKPASGLRQKRASSAGRPDRSAIRDQWPTSGAYDRPVHAEPPEWIQLRLVDRAGQIAEASVAVHHTVPARMILTCSGLTLDVEGADLLDCLVELRLGLEAEGSLPCCQGARPDVWPFGQLRQFTNGRNGYVLTLHPQAVSTRWSTSSLQRTSARSLPLLRNDGRVPVPRARPAKMRCGPCSLPAGRGRRVSTPPSTRPSDGFAVSRFGVTN